MGRNERQFKVGGKYLKFGIGEFALIRRLNFYAYPNKEVPHSTRHVSTYLNNNSLVKFYELEAAFRACTDLEDALKLD